jgi:galactose mutarotase-like enzyme
MTDIILQNEQLMVAVAPDFGARVTRLIDRATGRDWMAQGGQSIQTGEDAVYGLAEAVGWDECFPTVGRCDVKGTVWGRVLRDHGDLWGRSFAIVEHRADLLTLEYESDQFRFVRTLRLDGATLHVDYQIDNLTADPMPYLWALHGLLAVRPGERITLPGVSQMTAPYVSLQGEIIDLPAIQWPNTRAALGFDIDMVQPQTAGFAAKMYAAVPAQARAKVGALEVIWSGDQIGHLGLWFTYGGWPGVGGVHQLAIEPTNASAGDLAEGLAQVTPIAPFGHHRFAVQFTISPTE